MEQEFYFRFLFSGVPDGGFGSPQDLAYLLFDDVPGAGSDLRELFGNFFLDLLDIARFVPGFKEQVGEELLVFLFKLGEAQDDGL
jgi:hypothetical protein